MKKLFVVGFLLTLLASTCLFGDPVQIEVRARKNVQDLSDLKVQSFDIIMEGLWLDSELESQMREKIKKHFESTGLVFDATKKGLFVGVLYSGFSDYGTGIPGKDEWPSQTFGPVDSAYALLKENSDSADDKGVTRTIYIHILAPPEDKVLIRVWTGVVTYRGNESDISKLAPAMLDQLLLEYPDASGKSEMREVKLPN